MQVSYFVKCPSFWVWCLLMITFKRLHFGENTVSFSNASMRTHMKCEFNPISVVLSLISLLMWYASVSPLSNYYVSFIISNLLGNILKLLYEFLLHNFSILWWFSNSIIPCVSWHYNLRKRFIFYLIYLFTPLYWYRLMDSHFIQYVIIHYYHYSFWCSNCLRLDQRESF